MMHITWIIVAGLVGLLVGGLINLLADDLPYTNRVTGPHYPDESRRPALAWLASIMN